MKNIQVIDGAENCTYDIYSLPEEDFEILFPNEQDVEFIEEARERIDQDSLDRICQDLWKHPVDKSKVQGIHGTLYYELLNKKKYYPTKKEDEAVASPD